MREQQQGVQHLNRLQGNVNCTGMLRRDRHMDTDSLPRRNCFVKFNIVQFCQRFIFQMYAENHSADRKYRGIF